MRDARLEFYDINVRPTVITDPDVYWSKVQPGSVVGRLWIVKASDEDIRFLAKAASSGAAEGGTDPVELADIGWNSTAWGWR